MSKIIGVTVGTPMSADKIKEKIKPVTSVNGVKADETGNVQLQVPSQPGGGVGFTTDASLTLNPETKVLSVNTAKAVEQDNTLPITSAAVYRTVGNIEALLGTI